MYVQEYYLLLRSFSHSIRLQPVSPYLKVVLDFFCFLFGTSNIIVLLFVLILLPQLIYLQLVGELVSCIVCIPCFDLLASLLTCFFTHSFQLIKYIEFLFLFYMTQNNTLQQYDKTDRMVYAYLATHIKTEKQKIIIWRRIKTIRASDRTIKCMS